MARWWLALVGMFLFVSSAVALSGPGRIDIVDGQTRYEVAHSLVDHGDHVIRDERVWFGVYPGRGGRPYTYYRFPQSAIGVVAILSADATGPVSEGRRHFFFALTGAFACGVLAVTYAVLFRHLGHPPEEALFWAGAGVFCTPSWFYGTSTYDDILGTTALVSSVAIALMSRHRRPLAGAVAAGLMLGLAFNCKQPLGVFVLAILAAGYDRRLGLREQSNRLVLALVGLAIGVAAYKGYDLYKFPPGTVEGHGELHKKYAPNWPGNPVAALLALAFSLGTGVFFYCPPLPIALRGIRVWYRAERWFCLAILGATAVFVLFIASMTIFKGDPAWGPRYLTPIFAILWIFSPAGARLLRRRTSVALLVLGLAVQLGALSVDPHRLYVERRLPSAFYLRNPWLYFHPALSHLVNRPREIAEILAEGRERAGRFSPSPSPWFAFPVIDFVEDGPGAVRKYHILNSFRPWWISQRYLSPSQRPVDLPSTCKWLASASIAGLVLLIAARPISHKQAGKYDVFSEGAWPMALGDPSGGHVREEQVALVSRAQLGLLRRFMAEAPFQPATNLWRSIELPVLAVVLPKAGRGLDVGCGDGVLTKILRGLVGGECELVGIDPNTDEAASARSSGLYERVHASGAGRIPEPDASFDFAFANSVLEHIPDLPECLIEIARCLKPGGLFLATVPSPQFHECLKGPRWAWSPPRRDYLKEVDERLAHVRYWSEEEWSRELRKVGLRPEPVSAYLTLGQVRRWEFWSNWTGGLLYRFKGRDAKPIEIQRRLGLRRQLPKFLRPLAVPLAWIVGRGSGSRSPLEANGCFLIKAIKAG